jgi:hypothetical protein
MKTYKVTFSRVYEVPINLIKEKMDDLDLEDYKLGQLEQDTINSFAEQIARDWLVDEMPEFINNTEDFVSAKVEIKK